MRILLSLVAATSVVVLASCSSHPAETPPPADLQVNVFSYWGNVKSSPDARDQKTEETIIRRAVLITYPKLSVELKDLARQVTFYVDHSWLVITKNFLGFGPEDDPKYVYPDTTLYNPVSNPKGTIKINYTEKFVQAAEFMENLIDDKTANEALREEAAGFLASVVGHELLHVSQYRHQPVMDLERNAKQAKKDLEAVVKGHRQKVKYEEEAELLSLSFLHADELEKLAAYTHEQMKQHPDWFKEGGKYSLLSDGRQNPFVGRYMLESAKDAREFSTSHRLGESWQMIYMGQVRPVEIYLELESMAKDHHISRPERRSEVASLKADLDHYTSNALWQSTTSKGFPYLNGYIKKARKLIGRVIR